MLKVEGNIPFSGYVMLNSMTTRRPITFKESFTWRKKLPSATPSESPSITHSSKKLPALTTMTFSWLPSWAAQRRINFPNTREITREHLLSLPKVRKILVHHEKYISLAIGKSSTWRTPCTRRRINSVAPHRNHRNRQQLHPLLNNSLGGIEWFIYKVKQKIPCLR